MLKTKPQPLDLEKFAELEHYQWAVWTKYMINNWTKENIERWKRQIKTPYSKLSEKEKESDRKWARKVMKRIKSACEFYLRYKDNPILLLREFPNFMREIETFEGLRLVISNDRKSYTIVIDPVGKTEEEIEEYASMYRYYGEIGMVEHYLRKYNEWLFKLAFKFKEEE